MPSMPLTYRGYHLYDLLGGPGDGERVALPPSGHAYHYWTGQPWDVSRASHMYHLEPTDDGLFLVYRGRE